MFHTADDSPAHLRKPKQLPLWGITRWISPSEGAQFYAINDALTLNLIAEQGFAAIIRAEDDTQHVTWPRYIVDDGVNALPLSEPGIGSEPKRAAILDKEPAMGRLMRPTSYRSVTSRDPLLGSRVGRAAGHRESTKWEEQPDIDHRCDRNCRSRVSQTMVKWEWQWVALDYVGEPASDHCPAARAAAQSIEVPRTYGRHGNKRPAIMDRRSPKSSGAVRFE